MEQLMTTEPNILVQIISLLDKRSMYYLSKTNRSFYNFKKQNSKILVQNLLHNCWIPNSTNVRTFTPFDIYDVYSALFTNTKWIWTKALLEMVFMGLLHCDIQDDYFGLTALMFAITDSKVSERDILQLFSLHPDINIRSRTCNTALTMALQCIDDNSISSARRSMIIRIIQKMLKEMKPNLNLITCNGNNALMYAFLSRTAYNSETEDIILQILEMGVDINHQNIVDNNALHMALGNRLGLGEHVILKILDMSPNVNIKGSCETHPLTIAFENHQHLSEKILLKLFDLKPNLSTETIWKIALDDNSDKTIITERVLLQLEKLDEQLKFMHQSQQL